MCVIMCGFGGALPARYEFEQACRYNDDGYGWAVLFDDGRMDTFKAMSAPVVLDALEASVKSGVAVAWVFHARIATHGAVGVANCHPFAVGAGRDQRSERSEAKPGTQFATYLAHNGVLDVRLPKGWTGTDSEYFARELFPAWGGLDALAYDETWLMLESWLGSSKVVLLSNDPASPLPLVILNEELGQWEGDTWYSNTYHRFGYGVNPATGSSGRASALWDDDEYATREPSLFEACVFCGASDFEANACQECWNCQECFYSVEDCRCTPVEVAEVWR